MFSPPSPLWLADRDYITAQIWLPATPFQAKQSKSTEMKSLLTSMEISLLLLFFSRELLGCSCSNLHIKVQQLLPRDGGPGEFKPPDCPDALTPSLHPQLAFVGSWVCALTGCDGFQINPQQITQTMMTLG